LPIDTPLICLHFWYFVRGKISGQFVDFITIQQLWRFLSMGQFLTSISPRWIVLGVLALTVSACASADVSTIKTASTEQISSANVSGVEVKFATPRPHEGLKATLEDRLRTAMPSCATGSVEHRMVVTVTDFEDQNVAKSIFIGDEIELAGRVELIDAASGAQTAEYFVTRTFFWGGLIGAAMMSNAEASLSDSFTESVCEEVFGVKYTAKS
jgi:hypothetical protein